MQKQAVEFLDYIIVNTGNSDGWVLQKKNYTHENFWECHLGNFNDVEMAKKYAVLNFMICRPETFHAEILYRMTGRGGQYHGYYLLADVLKKEGFEMPREITCSEDMNCTILFNGKKI